MKRVLHGKRLAGEPTAGDLGYFQTETLHSPVTLQTITSRCCLPSSEQEDEHNVPHGTEKRMESSQGPRMPEGVTMSTDQGHLPWSLMWEENPAFIQVPSLWVSCVCSLGFYIISISLLIVKSSKNPQRPQVCCRMGGGLWGRSGSQNSGRKTQVSVAGRTSWPTPLSTRSQSGILGRWQRLAGAQRHIEES